MYFFTLLDDFCESETGLRQGVCVVPSHHCRQVVHGFYHLGGLGRGEGEGEGEGEGGGGQIVRIVS